MKKICLLFAIVLLTMIARAQLSGTKNIPGDYATLAAAITDLNTQGVGAGGVILNLISGNPQTAPAGGYSITATGTLSDQIILLGNGNTIMAPNTQVAGSLTDAIFKLIGADYVTIDGFKMTEHPFNLEINFNINKMTEWGVALLYASTTNGAQNNTIQNNSIDLRISYPNSCGIYSNSQHSATAATTTATATSPAGSNSGLKIFKNTIRLVNLGIIIVGPSAAANHNDGVEIGGSAATGNNINEFGFTGSFSAYPGVTAGVSGILIRNTKNFTVSYNTITSTNGGTLSGNLFGVYVPNTDVTPTGANINSINNNIISLRSGAASGGISGIVLAITNTSPTSTLNINNNDFRNSGHTVAGTGSISFIWNQSRPLITNINGNTFTNISVNTTGSVEIIYNGPPRPANAICNVNGNSIVGTFSKTGAGNRLYVYTGGQGSAATATEINSNNDFSNITVTGNTDLYGWHNDDGNGDNNSPTVIITNNNFNNWSAGTGALFCIALGYHGNGIASNNTISNISGGGSVVGITAFEGTVNIFSNTIYALSSTGASVAGIAVRYYTSLICNYSIHDNKIYDLQVNNATGIVAGIQTQSMLKTSIYNNFIGDLRAPIANNSSNAIRGINLIIPSPSSNLNVYYNTVLINATSSGTNFSTAGIFHETSPTASSGTLDLRNNIIVNLSTPNGTGVTTAYRRSSPDLANYSTVSNNNLFYAGTPGPANLIFFDGTNSDQALAAYQTRVSPMDALSVTENPSFISTVGSSADFLHIDANIPSLVLNGALPITSPFSITNDFDGDIRDSSTPEIGADEIPASPLTCPVTSWMGSVNAAWENPGNWSCGVPAPSTDVIIPAGATVIINSNAHVKSIVVNPAANLTINAGYKLTIHH